MIPTEILSEFKEIYFQDYKTDLSDQEALEKCSLLFDALDTICSPLTQLKQYDKNE